MIFIIFCCEEGVKNGVQRFSFGVFGVHFQKQFVITQGNHKGLPLHQKIFVSINKNIIVGAILYGCPK